MNLQKECYFDQSMQENENSSQEYTYEETEWERWEWFSEKLMGNYPFHFLKWAENRSQGKSNEGNFQNEKKREPEKNLKRTWGEPEENLKRTWKEP